MIEVNTNILGTFALKNGRVIEKILFPENSKKLAEKIIQTEKGLCPEEKSLVEKLEKTGTKQFKAIDPRRFSFYADRIKLVEDKKPTQLSEIASFMGIPQKKIVNIFRRVNLEITRIKMREIGKDQVIMQAVSSLDDLEESANSLMKRLREWNSLNFPELDVLVKKHDLYASIILNGNKGLDEGLIEKIKTEKKDTLGVDFSDSDKKAVRLLAEAVLELYATKNRIEEYLGEAMDDAAPNISALTGPVLGARLISLAGGLERMAVLPASTIQVLGAEDAFFRFLKTKKNPPKHGVIFQLPEIRSAQKKMRGRYSRVLAAKLAIAAKVDWFGGEFIGDKLRADFIKKTKA